LKEELGKLDKQLSQANSDFERTATGIDISLFDEKEEVPFDWKDELISLIKPGIVELKHLTVKARYKSQLQEELASYQNLHPMSQQAFENLTNMISKTKDKTVKKSLKKLLPEWKSVESQISNRMEIIQMELDKIEAEKESLMEATQQSVKNFFKTRGLFLIIAIIACAGLVLFLRLLYLTLMKLLPDYSTQYRPFHIRVIDLFFKILTLSLSLLILILVFYIFEDWVLLSLSIIMLLGLGWTVKSTLPRYWEQSRLMLNIGAVREGERIILNNIPWLVKNISMFSQLENPDLAIKLRVPIDVLMDKSSRKFDQNEPWFPCRKNDWVILSDGTRGCVVSASHEMVEMVLRGGSHKVYQTQDFLTQSPMNLSRNFRLKTLFGISYDLQPISTSKILDVLDSYIRKQIADEGYEDDLLNLRVEFSQAGGSSLDLVVISDFKGEMAPLYNRLNRAFQRWCVDACTENKWDIPFPQLMVHKSFE
ncbi:hypothetical protein QUF70_15450, partial [Desulfobacterales bacterium HSG17]|nr:hypothetical protein [Desulfobacterales bacterium HSG17]